MANDKYTKLVAERGEQQMYVVPESDTSDPKALCVVRDGGNEFGPGHIQKYLKWGYWMTPAKSNIKVTVRA